MDYTNARRELDFLYPQAASAPAPRTGLFARLGAAARVVFELPQRHRVQNELRLLTDRELADIGLSRGDVAHIYDADFAARREAKVSSLLLSPRQAA